MEQKKFVSLESFRVFLGGCKKTFANITHNHSLSDVTNLQNSLDTKANKVPTLSTTQRQNIVDLATSYYNNRSYFKWTGNQTRNVYVDAGCYNSSGKIKIACSLLTQLIWAGVSPNTFIGKNSTYTGDIVKAFDWGYYFQFPKRVAYGLTKSDGSPIGYVQPISGSIEGSYSANSYYTGNTDNEWGQTFMPYMYAGDMAQELWIKGYEVPLNEVMTGDLIFYKSERLDDNSNDEFEKSIFRNIDHVAIVTNTADLANGDMTILEASNFYTSNIGTAKLSHSANANKVRAANLLDRIVFVARHPAAFGVAANVPDKFTAI